MQKEEISWETYISEEKEGEKVDERVGQLLVLLAGRPDLIEGKELMNLSCYIAKRQTNLFPSNREVRFALWKRRARAWLLEDN